MKARLGLIVLALAALAAVPLATAGAQTAPTGATEGSIPPGGTVNCTTAPNIDPADGAPGTLVTVTADFFLNCDEFFVNSYTHTCVGTVTGDLETFTFPMNDAGIEEEFELIGTFIAPATEPDPPVPDAVEPLSVTVTCEFTTGTQTAEGGSTTYVYPAVNFNLLQADPDGGQPTIVTNDPDLDNDGIPDVVDDVIDVVAGRPTFTG